VLQLRSSCASVLQLSIRGHFPNDGAAMKLIWLQLREITKNWKMPPREWAAAKAQFAVVSAIDSRSIVNQPAQSAKFLTVSAPIANGVPARPESFAGALTIHAKLTDSNWLERTS